MSTYDYFLLTTAVAFIGSFFASFGTKADERAKVFRVIAYVALVFFLFLCVIAYKFQEESKILGIPGAAEPVPPVTEKEETTGEDDLYSPESVSTGDDREKNEMTGFFAQEKCAMELYDHRADSIDGKAVFRVSYHWKNEEGIPEYSVNLVLDRRLETGHYEWQRDHGVHNVAENESLILDVTFSKVGYDTENERISSYTSMGNDGFDRFSLDLTCMDSVDETGWTHCQGTLNAVVSNNGTDQDNIWRERVLTLVNGDFDFSV